MRMRTSVVTLLAALTLTGVATAVHAQSAREEGRLLYADQVLRDLRTARVATPVLLLTVCSWFATSRGASATRCS